MELGFDIRLFRLTKTVFLERALKNLHVYTVVSEPLLCARICVEPPGSQSPTETEVLVLVRPASFWGRYVLNPE